MPCTGYRFDPGHSLQFQARSSTAEPAAHNGQVARSTRAAPTGLRSGVEQRQLVWLITAARPGERCEPSVERHPGRAAIRGPVTGSCSGVEQRQLVWLITRRPWVRIPSPPPFCRATICRDSKGSPCAPLKPATSGCDPWSRRHSRVSSNGRTSVFQTDDASVRVRLPAPVFWQLAIKVNAPPC